MANYSEMTHAQLVALCSKQKDRIEDLEYDLKEAEEYKDDLEDLQADLSELDVYKDGLTGVCDYNDLVIYLKARLEEIEELKTSIQTTTSYHTDKNELLQERCETTALERDTALDEIDDLKEEIEGLRLKLDKGSEEHMKDTKKLNEFVEKNYVPKDILFAERSGFKKREEDLKRVYEKAREFLKDDEVEIRGLKEQISDLKEKYDELYELHYK